MSSAGGAVAPAASADNPSFSSPYFTPRLEVTSDDTAAGAHPNLKIRMIKEKINQCRPGHPWVRNECTDPSPYIEQDHRNWQMILPPGLMADTLATAERCNDPQKVQGKYSCPPGSKIGDIVGQTGACGPPGTPGPPPGGGCYLLAPEPKGLLGELYMGVPQGQEQARLYALVGLVAPSLPGGYAPVIRVDIVVTARQTPAGIEIRAVANEIPDTVCKAYASECTPSDGYYGVQLRKMALTLRGDTGTERGHPLLTNPASCQPRNFASVFTGHTGYAVDGHPGTGTGNTVNSSAPFPVTGCNRLAYSPRLSMELSDITPA